MASKKTWIWIVVGVAATCVVLLLVVAGAGIYFVSSHISSKRTTGGEAFQTFDAARARFKDQRPLLEVDNLQKARVTRPLSELPTSATRPEELCVLAWNPDDDRVVQVSLPFWLLKLGRRKMDVVNVNGEHGFDLERLNLDVGELDRIGPALVLDMRGPTGQRVLVWTK
jgi:hypothetical protein